MEFRIHPPHTLGVQTLGTGQCGNRLKYNSTMCKWGNFLSRLKFHNSRRGPKSPRSTDSDYAAFQLNMHQMSGKVCVGNKNTNTMVGMSLFDNLVIWTHNARDLITIITTQFGCSCIFISSDVFMHRYIYIHPVSRTTEKNWHGHVFEI